MCERPTAPTDRRGVACEEARPRGRFANWRNAALCCAALAAAAPSSAGAAVFDLVGGAVVDGDIVRLGDSYFVLSTGLGYQLLPRDAVRAVNLRMDGGAVEAGALVDWRAGVYHLRGADGGVVIAREGAVLARRAAPPAWEAAAASAPTPAPTAQSGSVAAAMRLPNLAGDETQNRSVGAAAPDGADDMSPEALLARGADAGGEVRAELTAVILGAEDSPSPAAGEAQASAAELDALARASLAALSGSGAPAARADDADRQAAPAAVTQLAGVAEAPPPVAGAPRGVSAPSAPPGTAIRARPAGARAGGGVDPFGARGFSEWPIGAAYRDAVLGRVERRHAPQVCAALTGLAAPLGAAAAADDALRFGAHHGLAPGALAALVHGFFAEADVAADIVGPAPGDVNAAWVAQQVGDPSLLRPVRLLASQADGASLREMAGAGALHVAIGPRAVAAGSQARLIAFEPLAIAAHPTNQATRLSLSTLRLLVSGGARKMQAIGGQATTLYLPPTESAEARQLRDLLGVERLQPYSARFIADPAARIAAAAADPNSLVVASSTLIGSARALAIGEPGGPTAKPDVDAVRSGAYPLVRPIYLVVSDAAPHALAEPLAAFFDGEAGRAAIRRLGLLPAGDCANGDCLLAAPGLGAARARVGGGSAPLALGVLAAPSAAVLGEVTVAPNAADMTAAIAGIEALLRSGVRPPSGAVSLRMTPMSLSGPRVVSADPSIQQAVSFGLRRAEALALALRCAEIDVMGVTRPQGAPSAADTAWRIEIVDAAR